MHAVSTTFKKLAIILAAFAAGDLVALYKAKMDHLPAYRVTFRRTYRATAVISTALIIFRKNPSARLVLWPAAAFVVAPPLGDYLDMRPSTPAEKLESESFGLRVGFAAASTSLAVRWLRQRRR